MSGRKQTGGKQYAIPTHTPLGALISHLGYTRLYVAEQSGVPRQWLWRYLEGFRPISPLHMDRLVDFFDLDPDQLQTPESVIQQVRAAGDLPRTGVDQHRR